MSTQPRTNPKTIETLADAVYPSFAMLAGMELDLFTPLKDGPLSADQIARAAGTDRAKTAQEAGFEYVLREPSAPSYAADFILARKPAA